MNHNTVIALGRKERRELFEAAEQVLGLRHSMIEKDFWVCWTLGELFSLPDARDVAHKRVFFASAWANYNSAMPGTFRLVPSPERLDGLARDYGTMREMYFREPPPWLQLVETLSALEKRINRTEDNPPC